MHDAIRKARAIVAHGDTITYPSGAAARYVRAVMRELLDLVEFDADAVGIEACKLCMGCGACPQCSGDNGACDLCDGTGKCPECQGRGYIDAEPDSFNLGVNKP